MVKRNPYNAHMHASYLFEEIAQRKRKVLAACPDAALINLGIGDTSQPIPLPVAQAMQLYARNLGTVEGYHGYGPYNGDARLRELIAFLLYGNQVAADDVFISDGAKCDIARLQMMFGPEATIAVQDPTYPAYVSAAVLSGKSGRYDQEKQQYEKIAYLPCSPENGFFPDLAKVPRTDLIFFCAPNNPTGQVPTYEQLEELVEFARRNESIIIFDSAYAAFIQDPDLPKSIYEIEGAREVAIESGSFSKLAGFTGIRLGWTVVPEELQYTDGSSVKEDWIKVMSSCFNGASNIAQAGGLAALSESGMVALQGVIAYYLENARQLKSCMEELGFRCYGGENAPYVWVDLQGKSSWECFQDFLENSHLVTTPGAGFGPAGEGFLRLSAFGSESDVAEACSRLKKAAARF